MKRYLTIFIMALAMLGITARAFCYQAEVIDISGSKYFPAVKEAEKSINLVMFTIETPLEGKNSKVSQLIDALIGAKNRGADVEVVLDQNVDFVHRGHPSDWEVEIKSTRAFKRLAELADEILKYLKTIKIDESVEKNFEVVGPSTPIDRDFLENPGLAPQMVKMSAMRDFDVYLYLLWKKGDPFLFENIAKSLGIYEDWTITDYRRQIIRALRNLEQRYKLIKFESRWGKEAEVTLIEKLGDASIFPEPSMRKIETFPISTVPIPNDYFNFGWNRDLSLRAEFCYFINLAYTDISDTLPFWSESLPTITKQFGSIDRSVMILGMEELRRKKLIEVKYDELKGEPYDDKAPKSYKLLKLYDPKELDVRLKGVEEKYGREAYAKARKYAEIVFEENNPLIIEDIILKTRQYGENKIKKAFDIVALKNTDNPKKSYAYVVGIIENK